MGDGESSCEVKQQLPSLVRTDLNVAVRVSEIKGMFVKYFKHILISIF